MPTITLKFQNQSLAEYALQKGASLTIGRRQANDIVIEDRSVSGHHAKIDSLEDRFVLIDLQSKNGTFVNGQLISSHWLQHEDVITIGGHSGQSWNSLPGVRTSCACANDANHNSASAMAADRYRNE